MISRLSAVVISLLIPLFFSPCVEGGGSESSRRRGSSARMLSLGAASRGSAPPRPAPCLPGLLDCTKAEPLSCGETVSADTTDGSSLVDGYACKTEAFTGPELVYRLHNPVEQQVRISLDDGGQGLAVILLRSCDESDCVPCGSPTWDCVRLARGDHLLVVDGVDGAQGPFDLTVDCGRPAGALDLAAVDMDISDVQWDCRNAQVGGKISVTLVNTGTQDATPGFSLRAFEDRDLNDHYDGPSTDGDLGTITVDSGLAAGRFVNVDIPLAGDTRFWYNRIHVTVDSEDEIPEADEENNTFNSGLLCVDQPTGGLDPQLEWEFDGTPEFPRHAQSYNTPVIVSLTDDNGDGKYDEKDTPDVVFSASGDGVGGGQAFLWGLNGDDGSVIFVMSDRSLALHLNNQIAAGDFDGDGKPEIVGRLNREPNLIAFEHDGTFKWISDPIPFNVIPGGAPVIVDLDLDGVTEIVFDRCCFNNDGTMRWCGDDPTLFGKSGLISCVADLDLDGLPEVVAGDRAFRHDGSIYWQTDAGPDGFCGIANFDDDPYPEIVVVGKLEVYLLNHDGSIIWGPMPGEGDWDGGGPPVIADFDNDCEPEIGIAFNTAYILFETDGSRRWVYAPTDEGSSGITASSSFDFNGDGSYEVVYADENNMRIFSGFDGEVIFSVPNDLGTFTDNPSIADVDGDGRAEIIVNANSGTGGGMKGMRVYGDDSWLNTRRIWNQHTYHITNVTDEGTAPILEKNSWEGHNNYRTQVPMAAYLPDLAPSRIEVGCDLISVRVGNGGGSDAPADVSVDFYDGHPESGGVLIAATVTPGPLAPGGFTDLSVSWAPEDGDHDIVVLVDGGNDAAGLLNECREANNECALSLELDCFPCQAGVEVGPDQEICRGEEVALSGSGAAFVNCESGPEYRWICPGYTGPWRSWPDFVFAPQSSMICRLQARCAAEPDCQDQAEVNIAVHEFPVADAGPEIGICRSETFVLDASASTAPSCTTGLMYRFSILGGPEVRTFSPDPVFQSTASWFGTRTYLLDLYCSDRPQCAAADTVPVLSKNCTMAVDFAHYDATLLPDGRVRVTWQTLSERDTLGFLVYKRLTPEGPESLAGQGLVSAHGPGSPYSVIDSEDAEEGLSELGYRIVEFTVRGEGGATPAFGVDGVDGVDGTGP